ncbi:MAG: hypothetical protein AAFN79_22120 [Pseudomonadota bacterium]
MSALPGGGPATTVAPSAARATTLQSGKRTARRAIFHSVFHVERAHAEGLRDGRVVTGGTEWRVTEDALIAPDGARAPRVAGRTSYWFAWSSFEGPGASLWDDR